MEAALAELGVAGVQAGDCYAAMADLVRRGPAAYDAILVALSDLALTDQEFFRLAGHRYRASPIYVYGPPCGEITGTWAVQSGARRSITAADVHALFTTESLAAAPAPGAEVRSGKDRVDDLVVREIIRPLRQASAAAPAPPAPEPTADEFQTEDIMSRREASSRLRRQPSAGVAAAVSRPPLELDVGPLLSPEELRALLGDENEPL